MNLLTDSFEYGVLTKIHYGLGSINRLPQLVAEQAYRKILICTDSGIVASGTLDRLERLLQAAGTPYATFTGVEPDPSMAVVRRGRQAFVDQDCDAVVGIGGGSSIDTAKGISASIANGDDLAPFEGNNKLSHPGPDVIAIPTTAGTGSEVTHAMVLLDQERQYKLGIRSTLLHPRLAILDPELLLSVPRYVAACTGMDALSHAVESYTSNQAEPITDALALHAMRLIGQNLRAFVARRRDVEAASGMLVASTLAGMSFVWGRVAAVHAISHPLGAHHHLAHGQANTILMPPVMRFNLGSNVAKYRDVAEALGEPVQGLSLREGATRSVSAVESLIADIGIPSTLSAAGVHLTNAERRLIAEEAQASGLTQANPRETTVEDLVHILEMAR